MGNMRGIEEKMLIKKDVRAVWRALTSADFCPEIFNAFEIIWNSRLDYRIERGKKGPGMDSPSVYHGDIVRLSTPRGKLKARFKVEEYLAPQRYSIIWFNRDSGVEPTYTKVAFHLFDCGDDRSEVTVGLTSIARWPWIEMATLLLPLGVFGRSRLRGLLRRLRQASEG